MHTDERVLAPTARSVLVAAVDLFSQRGYHGTSMREIANQVTLRPGALYNHFPSKQDILFYLVDGWLTDLYNGMIERLDGIDDPLRMLEEAIDFHVTFHGAHAAEMLITDNEIDALLPNNRRIIVEKRKKYEQIFQNIIRAGIRQSQFDDVDVKVTSYAIIGMCTHIASWYNPSGRMKISKIAQLYRHVLMRGIVTTNVRPAAAARPKAPASTTK